jgi:uncharacterized protein (TIGR03435 family)
MEDLARTLAGTYVRGHVIDRTGLAGEFDIDMTFDAAAAAAAAWSSTFFLPPSPTLEEPDKLLPNYEPQAPSLATALEEQLGLKLESHRKNVPALVVEHVEPLIEN